MIIDSSALVAILWDEPESEALIATLRTTTNAKVSAATVLETALVVRPPGADDLDELLNAIDATVISFDSEQLQVARSALAEFGRGTGSPARLNFGDCLSYALAKVSGEPLLFKGDDFTHTDITPAWVPDGD